MNARAGSILKVSKYQINTNIELMNSIDLGWKRAEPNLHISQSSWLEAGVAAEIPRYQNDWLNSLYKIDTNGASKGSICPRIHDIALIVWQSSLDIMIHAETRAKDTISPPSPLGVDIVRIFGGLGEGRHVEGTAI